MKTTRTRRSIATQLAEYCQASNLTIEVTQHRGATAYIIDGSEPLTPGQAADKYLPGGFAAAFGMKCLLDEVMATLPPSGAPS